MRYAKFAVVLAAMLLATGAAQAVVTIDMLTVGDPNTSTMVVDNNAHFYWPDPSAGAVDYTYEMGEKEITASQYVEFMNSNIGTVVAYELLSSQMANADSAGITLSGAVYVAARPDVAINYVSWGQAARFANWMHNGQLAGATETGAYTINGAITDADLAAVALAGREADAAFFLPSLDEWVKAAYYGAGTDTFYDYPTSSDTAPTPAVSGAGSNLAVLGGSGATLPIAPGTLTGTTSPYGAFDMAGNVNEYIETTVTMFGEGISMMMGNAWVAPSGSTPYAYIHTNHDQQNDRRTGFRLAAPGADVGIPGDFDGDGDVDADDVTELCANLGDPAYDLDGDGDADEDDMIVLIETLVELTDGVRVGTRRGDFNLDGFVDGTDLALMKTAFGQPLMDYADGNANCDAFVDGTDLAI
ncbi:MAG TPA: hypothetical protein ENH80_12145, partial [Phycisphaerae bacterium]|nr:hypothetical protein [Phycisphaerae bacterium]HDZ44676.1 hypothetical protein [Phycisphaerae bacterium]